MFSSPTPAQGSRALATNALRNAGLMDRDEKMKDVSAGGRKGTSKIKSHRARPIDQFKNSSGTSSTRFNSRLLGLTSASTDPRKQGLVTRTRAGAVSNSTGGGTVLRVKKSAKGSLGTVEVWKQFLANRYNAEAKFLNLERMAQDDYIIQNKIAPPGHPDSSSRVGAVIFKLASQLQPPVETISLGDNNISNGETFRDINRYLPNLKNLSLAGNKLKDMRDLDNLSSKRGKLVQLRELVLAGNPVREDRVKAGSYERFKSDIARKFTSLELLDGEPLPKISFDVAPQPSTSASPTNLPEATSFPCQMAPSFITGVDGGVVSSFLVRFFELFDKSRSTLVDIYDPTATFSFSCNTSIPQRGRIQGFNHTLPNQKHLTWRPWIENGSRNLNRISGEVQNIKYLNVGWTAIQEAISKLPATRHEIAGPPENFCLDAFPVALGGESMGLMVNVHGQFAELPSEGLRSFDRTFILAMAPPGSRAQSNGWNVIILSDQFIVRNYSSPEWWKPGPLTLFNGAPMPSSSKIIIPPEQQQLLDTVPEPQRTQVNQVVERTRLTVQWAIDCLVQNGWDTERAVANFQEVKATLGKEAFL